MLSDRQAEFKSALALIRPISLEVEDLLTRLPGLLVSPADCRDQIIELVMSLSDTRSRLLDLQEAMRDVRASETEHGNGALSL